VGEHSWRLSVRDEHGRTRRGVVVLAESVSHLRPLDASDEFRIVLLTRPRRAAAPTDATAVCIPAGGAARRTYDATPARLSALRFSDEQMAAYREGSTITAMPIAARPADVFPAGAHAPELQQLARALIEAVDAETVAAYIGTARHALGLRPRDDALAELTARLSPRDPLERPSKRAPGIARLHRALADLHKHAVPAVSLEQFVEDLRLLRMFGPDDAWPREAMRRLLADVEPAPARLAKPARVVEMARRRRTQ
jgi:hypothetical protein